jgi:hypothetical protein
MRMGTKCCHAAILLMVGACASATDAQVLEPPSITALHGYIGKWSCNGEFPTSGKKIFSAIEFEPDLGGMALVKHHDDQRSTVNYHAIETWVYDSKQAHLVAGVVDNFGGVRTFYSDGIHDGTLTWTLQGTDQPMQKFIYTHIDDTHFRLDWMMARPGKGLVVGDTLTCARAGAVTG